MTQELSRRSLLATSGAVAAGAVALGLSGALSGCSNAPAADLADTGDGAWDSEADLVIVGAGMGGLSAGIQALQNGIPNVTIVEVSRHVGGGSSFSNGSIHVGSAGVTEESFNAFTRHMSTNEVALAAFMDCAPLQEWCVELNLPGELEAAGTASVGSMSHHDSSAGRFYMLTEDGERGATACVNFFTAMANLFEEMGGTLLRETAGKHIVMNDRGEVAGILCTSKDGTPLRIATTQVVLANGGWQNNEELKSRYLGIDGAQAALMGVPYSNGNGLKMAEECGAMLTGDMSHFAGLFVAASPARNWMEDVDVWESTEYDENEGGKWWLFNTIVDAIPESGILVNCFGQRFCDEEAPGHSTEPDIARQRRGTAVAICDAPAYEEWMASTVRGTLPSMKEKIDLITSDTVGGTVYSADTLEELADKMNESGIATHFMHKGNLVKTVEEYNQAAEAGTGEMLSPARVTRPCNPIATPPFYAFPMRNAIFMTFGGVQIDTGAHVIGRDHRPIPGLYATSPCAGGMMHEFYCGAIAHAGVTGRWAANSAAEALGL